MLDSQIIFAALGWQAWMSLGTTAIVLLLLAVTRISADIVLMAGLSILLVGGVLSPSEALKGFANEGVMTIAALYIVAAGLKETGAVAWLAHRFLGQPGTTRMALLRVMLPTSLLSAFINNTPVVAMFIPAVQDWARRMNIPASRLLLPLSYAAILGGTCTLIGTSTNLVVNGLLIEYQGGAGLGMFEVGLVGFPLLILASLFILMTSCWLLPDRAGPVEQLGCVREYAVEMRVTAQGGIQGRSIQQAGLRHLAHGYLVDIYRGGELLSAVSPNETLQIGDQLFFVGTADSIIELRSIPGLEPVDDQHQKLDIASHQRALAEVVIAPGGSLEGQSVRAARFRTYYNAAIISVSRNGARLQGKIGDLVLRGGDTLLLETSNDFINNQRNNKEFLLISPLQNCRVPDHRKAPLSLAILAIMVAANSSGLLPMLHAALLAAGLMLATRCMASGVARNSLDISVLTVIASSFALGSALTNTGAAQAIASQLIGNNMGPWLTLAVIYALTSLFTEVITNNAAAVLMMPIATAVAEQLGVSYMPYVITLMFAASASFMTPIGYQTNLMVYGPGGYRFTDYMRIGLPLNLLAGLITVMLVPLIWPF